MAAVHTEKKGGFAAAISWQALFLLVHWCGSKKPNRKHLYSLGTSRTAELCLT